MEEIFCPYCGKQAKFMTSVEYYGRDYGKNLYVCHGCKASVGTHGNTKKPLGTLANKELKNLRMMCHGSFDVLWKQRLVHRGKAYQMLMQIMALPKEDAHISHFTKEQCILFLKRFPYYLEKYVLESERNE